MSDLQPDDIVQVKTALIETYLRGLTEIGGFVTPRLDANRIRASIADLKAPTRQVVPAWPALEAAPGDRLALGIGQADDGSKTLEVKLQRGTGEALKFAQVIQELVPGTHVVSSEEINMSAAAMGTDSSSPQPSPHRRPLRTGLSIGVSGVGAGTAGPFVSYKSSSGSAQCGFLTSLSALTRGDEPDVNALVYQPGLPDVARLTPEYQIGRVKEFVVLSRSTPNLCDAAIVSIDSAVGIEGNRVPEKQGIPGERMIKSVSDAPLSWLGTRVAKVGRTTGLTYGTVSVVEIDSMTVRFGHSNYLFNGIFEIKSDDPKKPFAMPGDAGSLVFQDDTGKGIGMVSFFGNATDGPRVYATRLDHALSTLNASLLQS